MLVEKTKQILMRVTVLLFQIQVPSWMPQQAFEEGFGKDLQN
jgi:hypothetical protein